MDKKLFGTRINKARKDRGLTAEKLAEACNIKSTYLRQIEESDPTPSQIEMLAEMAGGHSEREIGKVYERKNEYSPASSDAGLFRVFAVIRTVKCYYRAPILL